MTNVETWYNYKVILTYFDMFDIIGISDVQDGFQIRFVNHGQAKLALAAFNGEKVLPKAKQIVLDWAV
jgi:hypothetical protein